MRAITCTFVAALSVIIFFLIYFINAESLANEPQAKQIVDSVHLAPDEAVPITYPHGLRFKILAVTNVDQTTRDKLLQLKVQRWYGKTERHYDELCKKYETQELTILFRATPDAVVRVGDIIDYRIAGYFSPNTETNKPPQPTNAPYSSPAAGSKR